MWHEPTVSRCAQVLGLDQLLGTEEGWPLLLGESTEDI